MKQKILSNEEKLLLKNRSVIESVNDKYKNICQMEYARHGSIARFIFYIMSVIEAYSFFLKKLATKRISKKQIQNKLIAA